MRMGVSGADEEREGWREREEVEGEGVGGVREEVGETKTEK